MLVNRDDLGFDCADLCQRAPMAVLAVVVVLVMMGLTGLDNFGGFGCTLLLWDDGNHLRRASRLWLHLVSDGYLENDSSAVLQVSNLFLGSCDLLMVSLNQFVLVLHMVFRAIDVFLVLADTILEDL